MQEFTKVSSKAVLYRLVKEGSVVLVFSIILGVIVGVFLADYFGLVILVIVSMLMGIVFLRAYLEYLNWGYQLETNSLNFRKGMLAIKRVNIPYARITNATFHQSLFQRLFSVGDLVVDQEDSEFVWDGVDNISADKVLSEVSKKSNVQPIAAKNNS